MEIETLILKKSASGRVLNITVPTSSMETEHYRRLKKSILKETEVIDMDIILNTVIDNGDGFRFSKSVNAGFLEQDADYYLNVNDDVEILPNTLKTTLKLLSENRDIGLVGTLLYYPSKRIQHAGVRVVPSWKLSYFYWKLVQQRAIFDSFRQLRRYRILGIDHFLLFLNANKRNTLRFGLAIGAYHLISRQALLSTGGYDENFRMGMEDVDFCLSIIKSGFKVRVDQRVSAIHFEGKSGIDYWKKWGMETTSYFYSKWNAEYALNLVKKNGSLIIS
jgi:GT2 family glycosyltransferase